MTAILLLAASADPAAAPPPAVLPSDWALEAKPPRAGPRSCREGLAAGEIVVCGQRPEDFLPGTPDNAAAFAPREPYRIQFMLGEGATVGPDMEAAGMPDGRISKRILILIRFRIPF
ncbi:MAG: hypothetical protein ACK40O_12015 [Allosphingosinicella sp.]